MKKVTYTVVEFLCENDFEETGRYPNPEQLDTGIANRMWRATKDECIPAGYSGDGDPCYFLKDLEWVHKRVQSESL